MLRKVQKCLRLSNYDLNFQEKHDYYSDNKTIEKIHIVLRWHISVIACQIFMSICQISVLSSQLFMSTCQINVDLSEKFTYNWYM